MTLGGTSWVSFCHSKSGTRDVSAREACLGLLDRQTDAGVPLGAALGDSARCPPGKRERAPASVQRAAEGRRARALVCSRGVACFHPGKDTNAASPPGRLPCAAPWPQTPACRAAAGVCQGGAEPVWVQQKHRLHAGPWARGGGLVRIPPGRWGLSSRSRWGPVPATPTEQHSLARGQTSPGVVG